MAKTRWYYSLLTRDAKDQPFGVAFGDYDYEVVAQERRDLMESEGLKRGNTLIINTTDAQADIDAAVAFANT